MATGTRRVTDKYKWISAGNGAIEIGTSSVPLNIKTASDPLVQLYTTSALTTGNSQTMEINQVMTAAATAGYAEAFKVNLTAGIKTGAWANAIFGRMNYSSGGYAYGVASAICGELSMPPGGPGQGEYSVFQAEIDCPTGCNGVVPSFAVLDINVWGNDKSEFDDNGVLFDISGVTSGDGKFYEDATVGNIDGWVKCRINAAIYYIRLSDDSAA